MASTPACLPPSPSSMEELKMSGSIASYDQLVRQVEALKKENHHLRRELQDNSNHLSKLEHETSDMKEVLKHLQGKLDQEAKVIVSSGQMDVMDQLKALQMDITSLYSLKFPAPALVPEPVCRGQSPGASPAHSSPLQRTDSTGDLSRTTVRLLEELDRERCFLLSEIEKEDKEKLWYYTQLQSLSQRLDELPHVETFSMQMDLIRQQLEFETQHIRTLMEERFGTTDEMVQRAQIRASRLEQLDNELMEAQDKVQQAESQLCGKQLGPGEDGSLEAPTHPEAAATHPGNSKVEVVFWLLSMLAARDNHKDDMSRTLLAMSSSQDSCLAMRKSGCLPLLIQVLHDSDQEPGAPEDSPDGASSKDCRMRANAALHNIVFSQPDEGQAKKEMRVLHVLEQIRSYSETCWDWLRTQSKKGAKTPEEGGTGPIPIEPQICQATCAMMKLSFDEDYRRAMNELGGLQAIAELLHVDYEMHKMTSDSLNLALRRYAGMTLTNLTFGDVVNKATLCARRRCMQAIVAQLVSDSEELHQVVSSILRNLSWRADMNSKKVLREVGSVSALMQCALRVTKESTLKSILSALWNLSAHSTENKAAICAVEGALAFLVSMLTYKCQSNSLAIIESGGGILRNVSSLIATREDYRQVLRDQSCLQTLLQHLKSHSLTIVSNACGTLWNLSARSSKDQELLWDLGAVSMLRNLVHSKHKMIAMGSAAALRNLLANRPIKYKDATVVSPGSCMPSLYMRKQKALEAELDAKHLAETWDSMEKQTLKSQSSSSSSRSKKPSRHIESLVKDYASDSGCFDDDEVPNGSSGAETGNSSILALFLNSSSFLQGQALPRATSQRRCLEPEKDERAKLPEAQKALPPLALLNADSEGSMAAEKLASNLSTGVTKIDKLVEDSTTLHTSSDESFSLSSEDHCLDWQYGSDEAHEARAQPCSPCQLLDAAGGFARRAQTLLRLKTAYTSLSNDSLNSGSTGDGYCTKEHMRPCTRTTFLDFKDELHRYQKRPSRLDLKDILVNRPEKMGTGGTKCHVAERPESFKKAGGCPRPGAIERDSASKTNSLHKLAADPQVLTIKLSPSYQRIPLDSTSNTPSGPVSAAGSSYPKAPGAKQDWLPSGLLQEAGGLSKIPPEKLPVPAPVEQVQNYSVEDTPICFSRCSSLSSLSSADNALDGQSHSEHEMDSDSSLEIIEVDEVEAPKAEPEAAGREAKPVVSSQPINIPFPKKEKLFVRGVSPSRPEDLTPSSSSENYIQETPLVMSRCSSVSSLGSFESPSIASSIPSEPCSELVSGTISPSELPDSPGQTMPPSRSKTPLLEWSTPLEKETSQFNLQWENNVKKFMEITDFKERFQLPQDLDSMVYFTVEKPNENFSCASSLSALPLHEHYVQQDVELKLIPSPFPERAGLNFGTHEDEQSLGETPRKMERLELTSDEDIEILKECINSAMPSRFRKVRTSLVSGFPGPVLNPQAKKNPVHVPVYMLVPTNSHLGIAKQRRAAAARTKKDYIGEEDSFTDSAEGTPVNFSSATSLSDETLQYPMKEDGDAKLSSRKRRLMGPRGAGQQLEGLQRERVTSSHSTPTRMISSHKHKTGSNPSSPLRAGRAQPAEPKREHLELTLVRQGSLGARSEGSRSRKETPREDHGPSNEMGFQSFCHTTPTEEAVYLFYENDLGDLMDAGPKDSPKRKATVPGRAPKRDCWAKGQPDSPQAKLHSNLIVDEMPPPPCDYSSSVSSLSDLELDQHEQRTQLYNRANRQMTLNHRRQAIPAACCHKRDTSASSLSCNSGDDLLQKCISPVLPKRRRHSAARKRHADKERKGPQTVPDEAASDRGSDLDSIDWKAIQEGANSIVTWLHQASSALAAREPSSESDSSTLSFMSGLSVGSTWQLSPDRKDKTGQGSHAGKKDQSKTFKGDKKLVEARAASSRTAERISGQQKPGTSLPVVFRGRTVIYMPSVAKEPPSARSTPRKTGPAPKQDTSRKPLNLNQPRSRSLHRPGKISEMADLTLPKRSATPPARITKASSSGSSRTSTPSQPNQKKLASPSQLSRQMPSQEVGKVSGGASPGPGPNPVQKSPVSKQHKTQKSPVRIPFMQKPSRKTLPVRNAMPVLQEQAGAGGQAGPESRLKANGKGAFQASRLNLVRMSSARSVGAESDRSGFLRQLTFIKESSSLILRHRAELSSPQPAAPRSQGASPQRSSLALPTVFLCSSRCNELQASKRAGMSQRPTTVSQLPSTSPRASMGSRPARRTSSESRSRLPVKASPGLPEPLKHYASSPQINVTPRAGSPASSTREPVSGRKKREEPPKVPAAPTKHAGQQCQAAKGTWKRIRDEDIPHILKSTLPSTALPLVNTLEESKTPQARGALQRKTSDAVVQTEDFATTKTNSSTSPTLERQQGPSVSMDGGEVEGHGLAKATAVPISFTHEGPVGSLGTFPPSRHSSPSRAARVTPFNYTPSPMVGLMVQDPQREKVQA